VGEGAEGRKKKRAEGRLGGGVTQKGKLLGIQGILTGCQETHGRISRGGLGGLVMKKLSNKAPGR